MINAICPVFKPRHLKPLEITAFWSNKHKQHNQQVQDQDSFICPKDDLYVQKKKSCRKIVNI